MYEHPTGIWGYADNNTFPASCEERINVINNT